MPMSGCCPVETHQMASKRRKSKLNDGASFGYGSSHFKRPNRASQRQHRGRRTEIPTVSYRRTYNQPYAPRRRRHRRSFVSFWVLLALLSCARACAARMAPLSLAQGSSFCLASSRILMRRRSRRTARLDEVHGLRPGGARVDRLHLALLEAKVRAQDADAGCGLPDRLGGRA